MSKVKITIVILPFVWFLASITAAQELTISYTNAPPGSYQENGEPKGEFIDQIKKIMANTDIEYNWRFLTLSGIVDLLDDGRRKMCEPGRIYTVERYQKWRFVPTYLEKTPRYVIATRTELAEKIKAHKHISNLLNDSSLEGLIQSGQHFSPAVLKAVNSNISWFKALNLMDENPGQMVANGRVDYTISFKDQWVGEVYSSRGPTTLVEVELEGQYMGGELYIVCTKSVPAEVIKKITTSMEGLGYQFGSHWK